MGLRMGVVGGGARVVAEVGQRVWGSVTQNESVGRPSVRLGW